MCTYCIESLWRLNVNPQNHRTAPLNPCYLSVSCPFSPGCFVSVIAVASAVSFLLFFLFFTHTCSFPVWSVLALLFSWLTATYSPHLKWNVTISKNGFGGVCYRALYIGLLQHFPACIIIALVLFCLLPWSTRFLSLWSLFITEFPLA
jgi:hypothetical protein